MKSVIRNAEIVVIERVLQVRFDLVYQFDRFVKLCYKLRVPLYRSKIVWSGSELCNYTRIRNGRKRYAGNYIDRAVVERFKLLLGGLIIYYLIRHILRFEKGENFRISRFRNFPKSYAKQIDIVDVVFTYSA